VLFSVCGRVRAGVALVRLGDLHRFASRFLHLFGQDVDLIAVAALAGVTRRAKRCPSVSTAV
jgi:hypothetical protein